MNDTPTNPIPLPWVILLAGAGRPPDDPPPPEPLTMAVVATISFLLGVFQTCMVFWIL